MDNTVPVVAPLPPAAEAFRDKRAANIIKRAFADYKDRRNQREAATTIQRVYRGHLYGRHTYRNPYDDNWVSRPFVTRQTVRNLGKYMGIGDDKAENKALYRRWLRWRKAVTADVANYHKWHPDRQDKRQFSYGPVYGGTYRYPSVDQMMHSSLVKFNRQAASRAYLQHMNHLAKQSGGTPARINIPDLPDAPEFRSPPRRQGKHELDFRLPNPNSPSVFRARQLKVSSPTRDRVRKQEVAQVVREARKAERVALSRSLPVYASPRSRSRYLSRSTAPAERPAILRHVLTKHVVRKRYPDWTPRQMMKRVVGLDDVRASRQFAGDSRRKSVRDTKLLMRRLGGLTTPMRTHVNSYLPRRVYQSVSRVPRRVMKARPPSGRGYIRTVAKGSMKRTRAGTFKPYTVKGADGAPYTITDEKGSGYYRVGNKIIGTVIV